MLSPWALAETLPLFIRLKVCSAARPGFLMNAATFFRNPFSSICRRSMTRSFSASLKWKIETAGVEEPVETGGVAGGRRVRGRVGAGEGGGGDENEGEAAVSVRGLDDSCDVIVLFARMSPSEPPT